MRQAYPNELIHGGTKGMKWGYTKGHRNGNRTAVAIPSVLVTDETLESVVEDAEGLYEYLNRDKSKSPLHNPDKIDASTVNVGGNRRETNIIDFIAKWSTASVNELADYVPSLSKIRSLISKIDFTIYDKKQGGWFPGFKKGGSK